MESEVPRRHGLANDGHVSSAGLPSGEDQRPQPKTSVMKKVKAKAKKVKETLKMHSRGHNNDQERDHESHDEEEYEEADEEMAEDPEVYGSPPKMESAAATGGAVAGQQPAVNLEKPTVAAEDRYESKYTDPPTRPFAQWQDENSGQLEPNLGRSTAKGVAHPPEDRDLSGSAGNFVHGRREGDSEGPKINVETPTAMDEDHRAPKDRLVVSNYQSKISDPTGTGGEEAGINPILRSFDKMNVYDEPKPEPKSETAPNSFTGSHDQFSAEPLPPHTTTNPEDPGSPLKSFDASNADATPPSSQSGYTEKISSATSAIAGKAITAKNVVASKLGYGGTDDPNASSKTQGGDETSKPGSAAGYGNRIAATVTETLAPVYEKVADMGSAVISKVSGAGTKQGSGEEGDQVKGASTVTTKEYLAEKLRPGEEDKALSEAISDALPLRKRKQETEVKAEVERKPVVGTVTESEEVKQRLGTGSDGDGGDRGMTETETRVAAKVSDTGKGAVDSIKGTVSSWFSAGGGGGDHQSSKTSQSSPGTTNGDEQFLSSTGGEAGRGQDGVGERRLPESGN